MPSELTYPVLAGELRFAERALHQHGVQTPRILLSVADVKFITNHGICKSNRLGTDVVEQAFIDPIPFVHAMLQSNDLIRPRATY